MSLHNIITQIEQERQLNATLLDKLVASLNDDIKRLEERKISLAEEFAERDQALVRLIEA